MANRCHVCGKEALSGNRVSHANNRTKRRFHPNLQRIRALVAGTARYIRVCTQCIKAGKIAKAA